MVVAAEEADKQKLRGGYYTPQPIARFLVDWALNGGESVPRVLEPSMGDGAFVIELARALRDRGVKAGQIGPTIHGVELFPEEIETAKQRLEGSAFDSSSFSFYSGDFFETSRTYLENQKFDIVLGNPPFIRYQSFPDAQRDEAMSQLSALGFKLNKLTNAWLFFLLRSITMMKDKSRLAMVIPAELLQVKYAAEAREFIAEHFSSVTVVTFKSLVFDGIQQEVVLLLAEKNPASPSHGIDVVEIENLVALKNFKHALKDPGHLKPIEHQTDKWTQYFLSKEEILLLRKIRALQGLTEMRQLASVDVGIVTGNNKFFVVSQDQAEQHNILNSTVPLVGKSASLMGLDFGKDKWKELATLGLPSHLLFLKDSDPVGERVSEYLDLGIQAEVHKGYKCRIRKNWYVVPSTWISDAFLLRQIHGFPKLILNSAGAACTDTIHRVRFAEHVNPNAMAVSFFNSLTFAMSEVIGRSYGGGVLELEPNEAEELLIPYMEGSGGLFQKIDGLVRASKIEEALDIVDAAVLSAGIGLERDDLTRMRGIWRKLSARRIGRR